MILARLVAHPKAIPGCEAVPLQFAVCPILFKTVKGHSQTIIEFRFTDVAKLRFRVVNVIDVNTIDVHIPQRLFELILKISRCHAVHTTNKILPGGDTGLYKGRFDIITNIARLSAIEWKISALSANQEFGTIKSLFSGQHR